MLDEKEMLILKPLVEAGRGQVIDIGKAVLTAFKLNDPESNNQHARMKSSEMPVQEYLHDLQKRGLITLAIGRWELSDTLINAQIEADGIAAYYATLERLHADELRKSTIAANESSIQMAAVQALIIKQQARLAKVQNWLIGLTLVVTAVSAVPAVINLVLDIPIKQSQQIRDKIELQKQQILPTHITTGVQKFRVKSGKDSSTSGGQ